MATALFTPKHVTHAIGGADESPAERGEALPQVVALFETEDIARKDGYDDTQRLISNFFSDEWSNGHLQKIKNARSQAEAAYRRRYLEANPGALRVHVNYNGERVQLPVPAERAGLLSSLRRVIGDYYLGGPEIRQMSSATKAYKAHVGEVVKPDIAHHRAQHKLRARQLASAMQSQPARPTHDTNPSLAPKAPLTSRLRAFAASTWSRWQKDSFGFRDLANDAYRERMDALDKKRK